MTLSGIDVLTTYNPCMVTPDTSPAAARNLMDQYSLRHLPVVDADRRLIGIISDVDLVCASRPQVSVAIAGASHAAESGESGAARVDAIMTESVVVIAPSDSPDHAVRMMLEHRFHSLPVVEDGRLVGVITSSDFLREFTHGTLPGYRDAAGRHAARSFAQIDITATLLEADRIMEGTGLDDLAVMQGDLPIGVISRRVLEVARKSESCDDAPHESQNESTRSIDPWINPDVPTLRSDATLGRAADAMLQHQATAVIIVDRAHALVGLLPQDAILQVIVEGLE
jgi:acetoin utilization protein AcuB